MAISKAYMLGRRPDYSDYLVHLTRDYNGITAKDNLRSILKAKIIKARNPHCIFINQAREMKSAQRKQFKTVCFSEAPISEINYLCHEVQARNINLSQFGLIFSKEFVREKGGNPVFYLDTHSDVGRLRKQAFEKCLSIAQNKGVEHPYFTILPFVNKDSDNHQFSWEREWRFVGNFQFELDDVFLGLARERSLEKFERDFPQIVWISPRWGRDRILQKLRSCIKQRNLE